MKKLFIILTLCLLATMGYGQTKGFGKKTVHKCGYDEHIENLVSKNPAVQTLMDEFEQRLKAFKSKDIKKNGPNGGTTVIPIVVTIVHGGTGQPENITDNQVMSQINAFNTYLSDYGFRLCLAQKDGNGNNLTGTNPGIQRIQNATLTNVDTSNELPQLNAVTPSFPPQKYLNIYVVKSITNPGQPGLIRGVSSMPGLNYFDGIAIAYDAFGNTADPLCTSCTLDPLDNQGKTLVHEFGHYLGLFHTFNGACSEIAMGDCENFGDKICDTPPVQNSTSGCPTGANTCNEGANDLPDAINNFMDYSNQSCVTSFTPGQNQRMLQTLNTARATLISNENLTQAGIICVPLDLIAVFDPTQTYSPCAGTPVVFNCAGITGATYYWDFGDGVTSTLEDPSHPFTYSETPYIVTLTVTRNGESASVSKNIYTTDCQPIVNSDATWIFGSQNILNFSSGTPIAQQPTGNISDISSNSAVQSTDAGQLQFFTNGVYVWNANQQIINPSNVLQGHSNHQRGSLILPNPANSNQYFIFTKHNAGPPTNVDLGFRYSIVNMVNGNPVLGTINTAVNFPTDYVNNGVIRGGMTVTGMENCNGGYWIFSVQRKTNQEYFLAVYSLNAQGVLSFQSEIQLSPGNIIFPWGAYVAPDGNHILFIESAGQNSKLYNFDKYTGILSLNTTLPVQNYTRACFSPDSKLLYLQLNNFAGYIEQFDLTASDINASRKLINTGIFVSDLQLGPDNKIYLATWNQQEWAAVIHYPNRRATAEEPNACGFTKRGPKINGFLGSIFPNLVVKHASAFDNTIAYSPLNCLNYQFNANVCSGTFSWNFGDSASASNTSALPNPLHTFSGPGTYTVKLTAGSTVITQQIIVGGEEPAIYGSLCVDAQNKSNHFAQINAGQTIQWSIVSGSGSLTTPPAAAAATVVWSSLPGVIRVTVTDAAGCVTYTDQQIIDCGDGSSGTACTPNLTFSSPESSTTQIYNTSDYIVTQNNYTVGTNNDITLKAANYILIKPDSHIKSGSLFLAKIQQCSAPRPAMKSNNEELQQLVAYPNPTDGLLHLEGIKFNEVTIFDLLGKSVFYSRYDSVEATTIDIASLQQGVYFVKVIATDNTIKTIKVIKQ